MNKRQELQIDSIHRGVLVLKDLPDVPEWSDVRRLRDELSARLATLKTISVAQLSAKRGRGGASKEIDLARRAIRVKHLIPVARRGKRLFKHESKMVWALSVPPARATALAHAEAALAMAKALRPHLKFCHAEGFRRGFLTELRTAGEQLRATAKQGGSARSTLVQSTWQLRVNVREARQLASILDAELCALTLRAPPHFESHGTADRIVNAWSRAIRLGKPLGRPRRRRAAREESPAPQV